MTAFLDIDLGAVVANWRLLAGMTKGEAASVVKADAYGLGAARVASALAAAGCTTFFTAHLAEAVALRTILPDARILALNGVAPHSAAAFIAHKLIPVLGSLHDVEQWRAAANRLERKLPAFLHLETGMNRLALSVQELAILQAQPERLEGVVVDTVMTHLIAAETPDDPRNGAQLARFLALAGQFPGAKRSIANSPGSFLGEAFHLDLIRPGAALYGLNTSPAQAQPMRPAVRLRAPILQIHDIQPGTSVGYGGAWTAQRPSRIATIGVGYADGLHRSLSNRGSAVFDDTPVPLVGRVSMDLSTFDVTDVPAKPGDLLTLLDPAHGPDALGREAQTIGYEILTSLGRRYERRYIDA